MNRCGLYFGSFRPMHIGHLAIVNYLLSFTDLTTVRLVFSPRNPWKDALPQDSIQDSLNHCRRALASRKLPVEVSEIEFSLPAPLYTINTLNAFCRQEPDVDFVLVIGADNLAHFDAWHSYREILYRFEIMVYPREGYTKDCIETFIPLAAKGIKWLDAPLVSISSTFIREGIAKGLNMNGFIA